MNNTRMMKKLLIATVLFFGMFTVTSQNEKKIYQTDIFSIQYPTNWTVEDTEGTQAIFVVKAPFSSEDDIFAENANIITQDLKGINITLDQYVEYNESQLSSLPNGEMISSTRETREGHQYHTLIFKGTMGGQNLKVMQLYSIKNEVAYVLTFTCPEGEFDELKNIGLEILKSFKLK